MKRVKRTEKRSVTTKRRLVDCLNSTDLLNCQYKGRQKSLESKFHTKKIKGQVGSANLLDKKK